MTSSMSTERSKTWALLTYPLVRSSRRSGVRLRKQAVSTATTLPRSCGAADDRSIVHAAAVGSLAWSAPPTSPTRPKSSSPRNRSDFLVELAPLAAPTEPKSSRPKPEQPIGVTLLPEPTHLTEVDGQTLGHREGHLHEVAGRPVDPPRRIEARIVRDADRPLRHGARPDRAARMEAASRRRVVGVGRFALDRPGAGRRADRRARHGIEENLRERMARGGEDLVGGAGSTIWPTYMTAMVSLM